MTLVEEEKKIQVLKEEEKDLVETKEKNPLKDRQVLTENLLKVDLKTVKVLEKKKTLSIFSTHNKILQIKTQNKLHLQNPSDYIYLKKLMPYHLQL